MTESERLRAVIEEALQQLDFLDDRFFREDGPVVLSMADRVRQILLLGVLE